jgi:hypothetical protein
MSKFRKKPVVIEAVQWHNHGDHPAVVPYDPTVSGKTIKGIGPYGWVKTLEGGHIVSPGDWIITGVKGEHYPCKPDIFAATYDATPTVPGTELPPHQQRVLQEKVELDEKLHKLTAFISSEKFATLVQDEDERGRLVCQEKTMKDYSAILAERIAAFGGATSVSYSSPSAQADQRIEAELVAAGLNAPRITADHIQALMDRVVFHYEQPQGTTSTFAHAFLDGFYLASGYSACVSAANFDAAKGQKYAKEQAEPKARDKLWEFEGYVLHSKLASA